MHFIVAMAIIWGVCGFVAVYLKNVDPLICALIATAVIAYLKPVR